MAGSRGAEAPKRKSVTARKKSVNNASRPSVREERNASNGTKELKKKRLAVGALLAFYRHLREISRRDLSRGAGISQSLLGMIENGARIPTSAALESIAGQLQLTAYQRTQLQAIAGYSAQLPEAPGWEVQADDLILGVPLFLRNMHLESAFQEKLDVEEVWVVTQRPLALEEPALSMLRSKLLNTNASFTYFVDSRTGEYSCRTLWERLNLESDPRWSEKKARQPSLARDALSFILGPPTLSAACHTIALFNPRSEIKSKFGRAAYYGSGSPIGVYALDMNLYEQLSVLLKDIYIGCHDNPGQLYPRDPSILGSFKLLKLP